MTWDGKSRVKKNGKLIKLAVFLEINFTNEPVPLELQRQSSQAPEPLSARTPEVKEIKPLNLH
jgi:hypothetical protein